MNVILLTDENQNQLYREYFNIRLAISLWSRVFVNKKIHF